MITVQLTKKRHRLPITESLRRRMTTPPPIVPSSADGTTRTPVGKQNGRLFTAHTHTHTHSHTHIAQHCGIRVDFLTPYLISAIIVALILIGTVSCLRISCFMKCDHGQSARVCGKFNRHSLMIKRVCVQLVPLV